MLIIRVFNIFLVGHADMMRKILLNSFRSDLHVFTLFFSVFSLLLQIVWLKTFILAVFSMSPRLLDSPLSFVENPSISTSWFVHTFGSEFDAMGKQTGWTFKPKSIAGSVGVKWPKIYTQHSDIERKWWKHHEYTSCGVFKWGIQN